MKLVNITWPGGSNAHGKADWSPLKDRSALFLPDADEPDFKAVLGHARKDGKWVPGGAELALTAGVSGPKFSPPEADANRQARPTESATRGRSFRHPLPQAICGSGTRLTATRPSIVDFKSKVKYYFSLDVVVVGPCGLRE